MIEMEQFSEETIGFGKIFERLDDEQKADILAFLRALTEEETKVSISDNLVH